MEVSSAGLALLCIVGGLLRSTEATVTWSTGSEQVYVSECETIGSAILYTATPFSSLTQQISYSLNSQTPFSSPYMFAVGSTGILASNSDAFNRLQTPTYTLVIFASDSGGGNSLTLTVTLTQCLLYGMTLYVAGGESAGNTIAECSTNSASSSSLTSFSFLTGNKENFFELTSDGSINVAPGKRLPAKKGSTFNLVVLVTEDMSTSGVKSSTLSVAVCVNSCTSTNRVEDFRSDVIVILLAAIFASACENSSDMSF